MLFISRCRATFQCWRGKCACLAVVATVISGCASVPTYQPNKNKSYVIRGQNHTFAIYNSEHRLLSHPILDLMAEIKRRQLEGRSPITDIYVVSHGWNYTLTEAIGNYHVYMDMMDQFMAAQCVLRNKSVSDKDLEDVVRDFKLKFESTKQICAVLIVKSTSSPSKLTIAGYDDNEQFQRVGINNPSDKLLSALSKESGSASKIAEIVTAELGRTLPPPKYKHSEFQPYFIFVAWKSTTQPITNIAKAVLPFGLDDAITDLTLLIDKVPLHLTTTWKQSLNAKVIAVGKYPDKDLSKSWSDGKFGYNGGWDADSSMGQRLPLSMLLHKLIRLKDPGPSTHLSRGKSLDIIDPETDKAISLADQKIHLVGHSYGAKVVTLAGMEAIRRWLLVDKLYHIQDVPNAKAGKDGSIAKAKNALTLLKQDTALEDCYAAVKNRMGETKNARDYNRALLETTSHSSDFYPPPFSAIISGRFNGTCLNAARDFPGKTTGNVNPIDSLVMFNPAMHPGELRYPTSSAFRYRYAAPAATLRFIPRKAIVYSRYDQANGAMFSFRDMILNAEVAQYYQSLTSVLDDTSHENNPGRAEQLRFLVSPFSTVLRIVLGGISLAYGVGYGAVDYARTTVSNLPSDLYHHVITGTMPGLFDQAPKDTENFAPGVGKGLINFIDFFSPVKFPKDGFSFTKENALSMLVISRDEREQGLYRLSRPALGKTGINGMAIGRSVPLNLRPIADFFDDKSNVPDYSPEAFCKFSARPNLDTADPDKDRIEGATYNAQELASLRDKIFSFDASYVYDSLLPPTVGAHSDLRSAKKAENCKVASPESLTKREQYF